MSIYRESGQLYLPVFVVFSFIAVTACSDPNQAAFENTVMEETDLGSSTNLYDMGVTDIDNDGYLDLFTTNHNFTETILINNKGRGFSANAVYDLGLQQNKNFPGLEPGAEPDKTQSGLFVFYLDDALVLENHQVNSRNEASGSIHIPWSVDIERVGQAVADVNSPQENKNADDTLINFRLQPGGILRILTKPKPTLGLPVVVSLGNDFPLDAVFVGRNLVTPGFHDFNLSLRDRHGMAWLDVNLDGFIDVFISRGGLHGRMNRAWPGAEDELLVSDGASFQDRVVSAGIKKDSCPGRQVAWVDYDSDGMADLYLVCGRGKGAGHVTSNQLYHQESPGRFVNVAESAGLDMIEIGAFVWLDADNDHDQDMIWSSKNGFWLYQNEGGRFTANRIGGKYKGKRAAGFSVADYDNDGYLDVFAVSKKENYLLRNRNGLFSIVDPSQLGLPSNSLTGGWVDFNNDGLVDFHSIPSGLYIQNANRTFDLVRSPGVMDKKLSDARVSWVDVDNDGRVDQLLATRYESKHNGSVDESGEEAGPGSKVWRIKLLKNRTSAGHWFQVNFRAKEDAKCPVGARVEIVVDGKKRIAQVGEAEGSRYSQGHYRVYFGLGKDQSIDRLNVRWSDGSVLDIHDLKADQILQL